MLSAGAVGRVMRSPGSSATSTMATSATTRPAALPAPSRSPPARSPHSIGAAADTTAVTGESTLMGPRARQA